MTDARRAVPSVSSLLEAPAIRELLEHFPRSLVVEAIRAQAAAVREGAESPSSSDDWAAAVAATIGRTLKPSLRRVINGTGVILHTNLGRAPLAAEALEAIAATAGGYTTLEYDVESAGRGSRDVHCVSLLRELTGAEDAIVVNNCASALVLALAALSAGREAIISRGELIEIGGSFRIPEIMEKSGALLVDVGTTNRTHVDDYVRACTGRTGAIVKVHRSNFAVQGFVSDVPPESLAAIASERAIPFIHDVGSGLLHSLDDVGLSGEPLVSDVISAGAHAVLFSGDKLLGGPQAGIIAGRRAVLAKLRSHPLARALRVDKLTIAALSATLALYRDPATARRRVPVLAMLTAAAGTLSARAGRIAARLRESAIEASVIDTESTVGGGSYPTSVIPSRGLAFPGDAMRLESRLRGGNPHVVGRVMESRFVIDLRTVREDEEADLVAALIAAC